MSAGAARRVAPIAAAGATVRIPLIAGAAAAARIALVAATAAVAVAGCREQEDPDARRSVREATITADVRSRLLAQEELERLRLAVDTRESTVRVSGSVHDSAQIAAVREIAGRVQGVERVELDLRVVPRPDSAPEAEPTRARPERRPAPADTTPEEPLPSLEEAG